MKLQPLTPDDTKLLGPEQQDGLIELFAAVTLADGTASDAELDWLSQRLIVTAFGGARRAIDRLHAAIARFPRDAKGHGRFVREAVARLAAPELGERTVFALLQLGDSDRDHPAERTVITTAAAAFGLDIDQLAALFERAAAHAIFPPTARGEVAAVRALLDAGTPIDTRDHLGWTPLHVAVARGHYEVVALLLERRAPVDAVHGHGSSPIFCACNKPFAPLVRMLVKAGANPNQIGKYGFVPLHLAAIAGQPEVAGALLDCGAHADTPDTEGNTALHHAAGEGHEAVVALLLARGASAVAVDASGRTPLHRAAQADRDECARLLIEAGVDPNVGDAAGTTPVYLAAINQPNALARLLAAGGAADRGTHGVAPLHVTAHGGFTTCARLLLDGGAAIDAVTVPAPGVTPLALARMNRRVDVHELLVARGAQVERSGGPPPREVAVDAIDGPAIARSPYPVSRADARVIAYRGYESLMWLSPKRRGPVAVRDPGGRVWIVIISGPDALAAFQHATATVIAWDAGEVVAAPRGVAVMFDVAQTWCDGIALDPCGPSPRLFTLEDCHKILQVERGPDESFETLLSKLA